MADDPLMDEDLILPPQFTFTPIRALRTSSRIKIAKFLDLDGVMVVVDELDVVNNFNGLAELIGFSYLEIRNVGKQKSPTWELLEQWTVMEQCENATIGNLWSFLYQMERFDVLKDCRNNILKDCQVFDDYTQNQKDAERYRLENAIQNTEVSNSDMTVDETKVVCRSDVKTGEMTMYDAFICYEIEDEEDRKFVRAMIKELEVERELKDPRERNLKLFVPGRDDLPGAAKYTIDAYLIEKRCKRMIIVMSRSYLKSAACDFQTKFAHALAPGARSKKLIPILREKQVALPRILKFLAICDFTKTDMLDWVWDRLYSAIIAPIPRRDADDYLDSETCNLEFPITSNRRLDDDDDNHLALASGMCDVTIQHHSGSSNQNPANDVPGGTLQTPSPLNRKPSKFLQFFVKKKRQSKELKTERRSSEILEQTIAASPDYRSVQPVETAPDCPATRIGNNNADDNGEEIGEEPPVQRNPVENVDSTRRTSSESFTMDAVENHFECGSEMPGQGIEQGLTKPTRDSSDCDEVTSSTSTPVFV